jgi:hypothetical protein
MLEVTLVIHACLRDHDRRMPWAELVWAEGDRLDHEIDLSLALKRGPGHCDTLEQGIGFHADEAIRFFVERVVDRAPSLRA